MNRLCIDLGRLMIAPLAILMMLSPALADIVHLRDGSKLEGTLKRQGGGWAVIDASGKTTFVGDDQVELIQKVVVRTPAEEAEIKLTALRRSAEQITDPAQGVDRFTKFIEQNKKTPAAEDAKKDLAAWKERQAGGLMKIGSQWVSPAEHAAMLEKSAVVVKDAREQIKSGRLRDATAAVEQLLKLDADNVAGLYLRGLLYYKEGQLGLAKKTLERVKELAPDHGPTMNNLGVILWQQKQFAGALFHYEQAMANLPKNRTILDNVAEALNAPGVSKSSPNYKKAEKRFQEQDGELQRDLAQEGLKRWGATYVAESQMLELLKAQERVKERLANLKQEYEKIENRLEEIDNRIDANDRSIRRILNDSTYVDGGGQVVRTRLPSIYYDIKRESDQLASERVGLVEKLQGFSDRAAKIQQEMPIPQFTGLHRIIETEGTPLVVAKPTKPADKPAPGKAPAPVEPKPDGVKPDGVKSDVKPASEAKPDAKPAARPDAGRKP